MLSPLQPGQPPRWMDTGATPTNHAAAKQQQQQATPQHATHPMLPTHSSPHSHSAVMSPESGMHSASHGRRDSNGSAMQDTPSSHDLVSSHSQHNLCSATESSNSSSSSSNANDDGSSVSSASVSPPAVEAQRGSHTFSFGAADSQRMEDVAGASATPTRLNQGQGQAQQQQQYESLQQQQHQTPSQMQQQPSTTLPPHHSATQNHHPSPSHASQHHPQQSHRPSVPSSPNLGSQQAPSSAHHSPSHHAATSSNSAATTSSSASGASTAPSVAKRGQGFSCHHCKTHKMPELLLFCSNQSKKGPGKKRCRKKYCDSCLKRLYGHPADLPLQSAAAGFQCPACLGNCVCAGCERKATGGAAASTSGTAPTSAAASAAGGGGDGASVGSNESNPSPHPMHPHSHSHSHSHSAHSLNSARSSSPGPISLPPSNSSSPNRPVHLQQQKPTTPQGKIAKKRRTSQDLGTAGAAMALAEDGSAMDANAPSSAASSSVFGTSAPSSAVHQHPPAHTRALSGDQAMLSGASFAPGASSYGAFSSGSNASALPPRSRGNSGQPPQSLTTSPRLAVLTASGGSAGSRMIHLPPFALASPSGTSNAGGTLLSHPAGGSPLSLVGLGSSNFASGAAAAFATHIQQQVQHAVQTAAAVHQTAAGGAGAGSMVMDTGVLLPELHLGSASAAISSHSPSLNSSALSSSLGFSSLAGSAAGGSAGGFSAPTSPFSTPRSNTRPLSAFSPVLGVAPGSVNSEVGAGSVTMEGNGAAGHSIANLSMPSPNVSPNLFKRTLLLGSNGDSPAKPTTAPAATSAVPGTSASPPGELELMKVLANVACSTTAPAPAALVTAVQVAAPAPTAGSALTTNSASLPPAHPVRTDAASPKLSGFMASVSLLSPPHGGGSSNSLLGGVGGVGGVTGLMQMQQLPPSAASVGAPLGSSLGVIQAQLKVQHQMEVACLLQQQHQQLAELERLAIQQEQHQQWQQQQQQQQIAARSSPLHSRMGVATGVSVPVPLTKLESSPPLVVGGAAKPDPSSSASMVDSQVIPSSAATAAVAEGLIHN